MDTDHLYVAGIIAGVAIVLGIVAERVLCAMVSRYGRQNNLPPTQVHLSRLIVRWAIIVVVIIVVLSAFGIAMANLWITMSAVILAALVGFFAGWSLLANILAALLLLIWRPFQIGDHVTVLPENIAGEAIDTNLFFTKLRCEDGDVFQVPNVSFFQKYTKVSNRRNHQ